MDLVSNFLVGATTPDIVHIDLSDLNAAITGIATLVGANSALLADASPTVTAITGAATMTATAGTDIYSIGHATAWTTTTLARALEVGGALALTTPATYTATNGFVVAYDDNANTYLAYVQSTAGTASATTFVANDLTVTNFLQLVGVADATTLLTNNVVIIA